MDPRGDGGVGRSSCPAGFDHCVRAVIEDHGPGTHALLYHYQPPGSGPLARSDRRGCPRLLRVAITETLRPVPTGRTTDADGRSPS